MPDRKPNAPNKPARNHPIGCGDSVLTFGEWYRWNQAIRCGKNLSAEAQAKYLAPPGAMLAGGIEHGFETVYNKGSENLFFFCCNIGAFRGQLQ